MTLRDITNAAGANVAAVSYHFGSKDDLVRAVVADALADLTDRRAAALEALPDDASLEELVRTWLAPALDALAAPDEPGRLWWRIVAQVILDAGPDSRRLISEHADRAEEHLLTRIAAHVDLPPDELQLRHAATIAAVGLLTTGSLDALLPSAGNRADQLVAYVVGAFSAPPAAAAPTGRARRRQAAGR